MIPLDSNVLVISLRFKLKDQGEIPPGLRHLGDETRKEHIKKIAKRKMPTGTLALGPAERCALHISPPDPGWAKYRLADGFYRTRTDTRNPKKKKRHYVVQFSYLREGYGEVRRESLEEWVSIWGGFRALTFDALWRVQVYVNPLYSDGEPVPEKKEISINLDMREELRGSDGNPATEWVKDESGGRVGDAPVLIRPSWYLRFVGSGLNLTRE